MSASRQFEQSIVWSQESLVLIGWNIGLFFSGTVWILAIFNGDLDLGDIFLKYESILTAIVFFQISYILKSIRSILNDSHVASFID